MRRLSAGLRLATLLICAAVGPAAKSAATFRPGDTVTLVTVYVCDSKRNMIDLLNKIQTDAQAAYRLVQSGHCYGPEPNQLFVVVSSTTFRGLPLLHLRARNSDISWWTLYNAARRHQ